MTAFSILIPARLSSSRLPNKALADIHGKPMVVRVAEQAALSAARQIVVATDHEDIAAACREHGVAAVMTGAHHQSGTTRLAEAAAILGLPEDEIVVNVQGDEPLIDPVLIDATAAQLADSGAPMATAAHPIRSSADFHDPNCVKVVLGARGQALYFSRAPIPWPRDAARAGLGDTLPPEVPVLRHIGIYAYRAGFLQRYSALAESPLEHIESLEQLRVLWHGDEISVSITAHAPAAGVDTQADLERVRTVFAAR